MKNYINSTSNLYLLVPVYNTYGASGICNEDVDLDEHLNLFDSSAGEDCKLGL